MIVSMPSSRLKSPTIGIEPPSPTMTAFLPHSADSAARVLISRGLSKDSSIAGAPPKFPNSTLQSIGKRARTKARKPSRILLWILRADQAERHLRHGLAGDHGLGTLAGIAADDAVDLGGRAGGDLLDQQAASLARRRLEADAAEELLGREIEGGQIGLDVGRQIVDAIVESRKGHATAVVMQRGEEFREHP